MTAETAAPGAPAEVESGVGPTAPRTSNEVGSVRPTWVSDSRVARWTSWVRQGADPDAPVGSQTGLAPWTLEPTAAVPVSTTVDVTDAVRSARAAHADWARTPFRERAEIALRFHDLLLAEQDEVIDLIQWETGKARFSAWQEIGQVAALARHYGRRAEHYLAPQKRRGMVPGATVVKELRVPKGVIGVISPWNYPLYLGVGDVLPALLAGNAVVSKADSQTPLTLLWTRDLMARAGLPDDVWQVVTGAGGVTGAAIVEAADFIMFTGSTATGRRLGAQAGERLIGASLELGGKNPLLVRADADLVAAAHGAANAAFANTGQMCIHVERIHVHENVYDEFKHEFVAAVEAMRLGAAYDYDVEVGSLTSTEQLATVAEHVRDAVERGASLLSGGRARPDVGPLFHELTVLEGVTADMKVYDEETFGPVVSLYSFRDDDDAVAQANRGSYGLSASIWGKDVRAAEALALRIRAGAVNINDGAAAAAGSVEAGMGGMGDSGLGRRHGAEGIRKYTDAQTVARQRWMPLGPPPGSSVERFVHATTKQLGLMKRIGLR
ncbi:succinic semialdehyde dehydrogenase [Nocardioides yefusunii]|uniref:Succinic semialdehyde dehydrogenase n=1 Tax=Nocardioides yefusunii TaxID=2500546 RepID=A0ABW1R1A5_9ACTN|nr:succinic semialdehyde dehydrogenase [Nocardioides yefusunii]